MSLTLKEVKENADYNLSSIETGTAGTIQRKIGEMQLKNYNTLTDYGFTDEDDFDHSKEIYEKNTGKELNGK